MKIEIFTVEVVFSNNLIGPGTHNFAGTLRTQLSMFEEADAMDLSRVLLVSMPRTFETRKLVQLL